MTELINYQVIVHGRVQGVGFRYSALNLAKYLSLNGFVKNMASGSVLLEIEGDYPAVKQMLDWCKTGPGTGHVEEIEIAEGEVKLYTSFEVRY